LSGEGANKKDRRGAARTNWDNHWGASQEMDLVAIPLFFGRLADAK